MRIETKLAVLIAGLVVVGVGLWYVGREPKDVQPDAVSPPLADAKNASEATPTAMNEPSGGGLTSVAPVAVGVELPEHRLSGVGSPAAFNVDRSEGASARPSAGPAPRVNEPRPPLPRLGLAEETAESDTDDGPRAGAQETEPTAPDLPAWSAATSDRADTGAAAPETVTPANASGALTQAGHRPRPETDGVTVESPWTSPRARMEASAASTRPAATPESASGSESTKTHVIERGDTFASLAARYLGNAKYAKRIADANPDVDPRRLKLGAKIVIPASSTAAASSVPPSGSTPRPAPTVTTGGTASALPPPPADRAYTVQPGDGWYTLAKRFLGNGNNWPELYELNKERLSGNSRALRAGMVIELPPGATTAPK